MLRRKPLIALMAWALLVALAQSNVTNAGGGNCISSENPCDVWSTEPKPDPWPDGLVPVAFAPGLSSAKKAKAYEAMEKWVNTNANIAFVPRTTQSSYVQIGDGGNATSHVGYRPNSISMIGITEFFWAADWTMAAHELGHALGFFHEHSRWDRSAYIDVNCVNMEPGYEVQYQPIPQNKWITTATAYDFRSIMHYRPCWKGCQENDCDEDDLNHPLATIHLQPGVAESNWDLMGRWGQNGISAVDGQDMRNVYGGRRNVYVNAGAPGGGNGYLRTPYNNMFAAWSEAASNAPLPYRIIISAGTYDEPNNVTINFPVIMRAVPGGGNVTIR